MEIVRDCENLDIGGKAANLCRLKQFCNVPPFFVIRLASTSEILEANNQDRIITEFRRCGFSLVAVRSSATCEDSKDASYAGLFTSRLGVTEGHVVESIMQVAESIRDRRASSYARQRALHLDGARVSIIIQQLVDSDVSGVCFTRIPTDDSLVIEACYGLGEYLVQGRVSPDRYLLDRATLVERSVSVSYQSLRLSVGQSGVAGQAVPFHLRSARKLHRHIAEDIGRVCIEIEHTLCLSPLDVEWAIHAGVVYILQARNLANSSGGISHGDDDT